MIEIDNLMQVANQIESERGVHKEVLFSAIEQALVSACRKKYKEEALIEAKLDPLTGKVDLHRLWEVVEEVENPDAELTVKEAKAKDPNAKVGSTIRQAIENNPDFGRLAAQTAKQVIVQRIREAEKESVYDEFFAREGQIITGVVQRIENKNYLINLGRTEAILHQRDQIPGERFQVKEKIKVYLANIEKGARGNIIHISRTHPGLLKCLFELEIPEIQEGIIEIKSVSREPGKRSKIAVKSNNPTIGAVGTCVGQMGARIQAVIKEIGAEKIDVLEWAEDPKAFIANALKPAKINLVAVTNSEEKEALVVVPNDQLSLAIGKQGINVRLSVKLTGWKLDIINEDEYQNRLDGKDGSSEKLSLAEKLQIEKDKTRDAAPVAAPAPQASSLAAKLRAAVEEQKLRIEEEPVKSKEVLISAADLAEMLGMDTDELLKKANKYGVQITGEHDTLSVEQVQAIKEGIRQE